MLWKCENALPSSWLISASNENSVPATAAEPYVVMRLSRFADSRCDAGTRLGTLASFAGIQNSDSVSMRNDAINSHHRPPRTIGIEAYKPKRRTSAVTMV